MANIPPNIEQKDLVIVGAGWYGLGAASTYLRVHPDVSLLVLEKASSLGGVWSSDRVYASLITNSLAGCFEFPDYPMNEETMNGNFKVKPGEHIPGHVICRYLTNFAKHQGLVGDRMRLGVELKLAEKVDDAEGAERADQEGLGWILHVSEIEGGRQYQIFTKKLVIATGLTSEPFLPHLPGKENFNTPIIHCSDMKKRGNELLSDKFKNVVVLGGTKSAYDAAYAFATNGQHVTMVIRASGHGPCWMSPTYVTPLKLPLEKLIFTRLLTFMSPNIYGDADGYVRVRKFLHGTAIGRFIVRIFWAIIENDVRMLSGYDKNSETKKLEPWVGAFWIAAGLSIFNYPSDFMELVQQGKIKVVIGDIRCLGDHSVEIEPSTGAVSEDWPMRKHFQELQAREATTLAADVLVCATGWRYHPSIRFVSKRTGESLDRKLGLPHHSIEEDSSSFENAILEKVDAEILEKFPALACQPKLNPAMKLLADADADKAPEGAQNELNKSFNLYRYMVPPILAKDRTIVFNGMFQGINTAMMARIQGLWITAYFDNCLAQLESKTSAEIYYETILHSRFWRWRTPGGYGAIHPDFAFDSILYADLMLGDIGLESKRKAMRGKGELLEPYGVEDYAGLVEEYIEKKRSMKTGSE